MASIISWFKKELAYLGDSFPEIIKGFLIFLFTFSGVGCAMIIRYLGFNGYVILSVGALVEAIGMILSFLLLKSYLKTDDEPKREEGKKGRK